jgi:hypothetical protein
MLNKLSQNEKNEIIALAKELKDTPVISCVGECVDECPRRKLIKRLRQIERTIGFTVTIDEVLNVNSDAISKKQLSSDILCCPFCGNPAEIYSGSHLDLGPSYDSKPGVGCVVCHFVIQRKTVREAVAVWNCRAGEQLCI